MKVCGKCKENRPDLCFVKKIGYKDGLDWKCKGCNTELMKIWRIKNPEKAHTLSRRSTLNSNHGIKLEVYVELLKQQKGKCKICFTKNPGGMGAFHVDHDHKTKEVRGLLCHRCNLGLGYFKDDCKIMISAVDYVKNARTGVKCKSRKRGGGGMT